MIRGLFGVIPTCIAVPSIAHSWMPGPALAVWMTVYIIFSASMMLLRLRSERRYIETLWTTGVGAMFGALPAMAVTWAGPSEYYLMMAVVMIFIGYQIAAIPLIEDEAWQGGVLLASLGVVGAGFWVLDWWVPVVLAPVLFVMITNADSMRIVKSELETARGDAERAASRAQHLAHHDDLTGLLDRRGLTAVAESLWSDECTVLMADVNRFKFINDTYGHAIGDKVLNRVATVLSTKLPNPWSLSRYGGDEFVAVAPGHVEPPAEITDAIGCLIIQHGSTLELEIDLSSGVATGRTDEVDRVVSHAGYALRAAKRRGGGLERFAGDLADRFDQAIEVGALDEDIAREAIDSAAQLIVDFEGTIVGCELLTRWKRSDGRQVPPSDFLPLVAENGLMPLLNDTMLEKGVAFAARFNNRPSAPFVSINLTSTHLGSPHLVERVQQLLQRYRVHPSRVMIEITESESLPSVMSWEATARSLRSLGVHLAIDDFGTGYSSVQRLNQLPISHLKFDRAMNSSVTGPLGEVLQGVVRFAEHARIGVIAEGIETLDQLEAMRAIGVDTFQGFYFGRPAPLDFIEQQIVEQSTSRDFRLTAFEEMDPLRS